MNNLIFAPDENISLILRNDENFDDDYNDDYSTPNSSRIKDTPIKTLTNKLTTNKQHQLH